MGVRYPSGRRIKIHFNYTVEQIARILGVHKHTVRRWEKAGLRSIGDGGRPRLYRGPEIRRFLDERRESSKRPCGPGEMFCFKCRGAREPFGGVVDLLPINTNVANLRGMCECGTLMHRQVSHRTFRTATRNLTATIPEARPRIGGKECPTVNAAFVEVWRPYAKSQRAE
jgi:hypothetical protein